MKQLIAQLDKLTASFDKQQKQFEEHFDNQQEQIDKLSEMCDTLKNKNKKYKKEIQSLKSETAKAMSETAKAQTDIQILDNRLSSKVVRYDAVNKRDTEIDDTEFDEDKFNIYHHQSYPTTEKANAIKKNEEFEKLRKEINVKRNCLFTKNPQTLLKNKILLYNLYVKEDEYYTKNGFPISTRIPMKNKNISAIPRENHSTSDSAYNSENEPASTTAEDISVKSKRTKKALAKSIKEKNGL